MRPGWDKRPSPCVTTIRARASRGKARLPGLARRVEARYHPLMRCSQGVAIGSLLLALHVSAQPLSGRERLIEALASDSSPRVRTQAALALEPSASDPEVGRALLKALHDADPVVRAAAAKALREAAGPEAFHDLGWAAVDPDPLVAKWAGLALRRVIARAEAVRVDVGDLISRTGYDNDLSSKTFQEVVLERLVRDPRYDLGADMDFREHAGGPGRRPIVSLRVTGVAFLDAMASDPEHPADPPTAEVRVMLRVLAPSGFVVYEVEASGRGHSDTPPPDPDADEYSLPPPTVDGRLQALRQAAQVAVEELATRLASGATGDDSVLDRPRPAPRRGASNRP